MGRRLRTIGLTIKLVTKDVDWGPNLLFCWLISVLVIAWPIAVSTADHTMINTVSSAYVIVSVFGALAAMLLWIIGSALRSAARKMVRSYEQAQEQVRLESINSFRYQPKMDGSAGTVV